MDRVTRAKLDSLVHQLRVHGQGGAQALGSVEALARRLQLDPMIVRRVAEQEGVTLGSDSGERGADPSAESAVEAGDPNQSTQVMSLDEVHGDPPANR